MAASKRILLGVTGSIAAYKSAELVRRLRDKNLDVSVVMTRSAQKFITPLTLGSLSGKRVHTDMFDEHENAEEMTHIRLAQNSDLILIAPATANIIAKMAHGIADDLLSSIILTTKAKVAIAPAMNDEMFNNTIVQENCQKLKGLGVHFIDPVEGDLACGTTGIGHLAEVTDIVKATVDLLNN